MHRKESCLVCFSNTICFNNRSIHVKWLKNEMLLYLSNFMSKLQYMPNSQMDHIREDLYYALWEHIYNC